jgi:hypothetical protein
VLERRGEGGYGEVRRRSFSFARAAAARSGLVLAAGGILAGELAQLPVEASVGIGLGAWLVRLTVAVLRRGHRGVPTVTIDPWAVPEPWRSLVQEAVASSERFNRIVADWPPGPRKERLSPACYAVSGAAEEVWRIARLGASLGPSGPGATGDALSARLRALQESRGSGRGSPGAARPVPDPAAGAVGDSEEEALAVQLQAVRRRDAAAQRVLDRTRVVIAQINAAVADVAGLALGSQDLSAPLDAIARLPSELEALRRAADEVG